MMAGVVLLDGCEVEGLGCVDSRRRAVRRMGWMRALRAALGAVREASMARIVCRSLVGVSS